MMPSVRQRFRNFLSRQRERRKSAAGARRARKAGVPSSPSSIMQIEEFQSFEELQQQQQSSEQFESIIDDISGLSIPSLLDQDAIRVSQDLSENQDVVVTPRQHQSSSRHHNRDKDIRIPPRRDYSEDQDTVESPPSYNSQDGIGLDQSDKSTHQTDEESLPSRIQLQAVRGPDVPSDISPNPTSKLPYPYKNPIEVPKNCPSLIGKRVKVKASMKDTRKRNQVGHVTKWKNKITVELKCDSGDSFGVLLSSIEFVEGAKAEKASTATRIVRSRPSLQAATSEDIFPYKIPTQVPGNFPSMIGKRVKVKDSLTDSKKRGKIGSVWGWKNKITVTIKCDSGGMINVRLSSIDFMELQTHSTLGEVSRTTGSYEEDSKDNTGCESALSPLPVEPSRTIESDHTTQISDSETFDTALDFETLDRDLNQSGSLVPCEKKDLIPQIMDRSTAAPQCSDIHSSTDLFSNFLSKNDTGASAIVPTKRKKKKIDSGPRIKRNTPPNDVAKPSTQRKPRMKTRAEARKSALRNAEDCSDSLESQNSWVAPQNVEAMTQFGGNRIDKLILRNKEKKEVSFFDHLLKDRIITVEIPVEDHDSRKCIHKKIIGFNGGCTLELISCKTFTDVTGAGGARRKSKVARIVYATTSGLGLKNFCTEDQLLRIADFTTLPPRKIAARLELFQSPSNLNVVRLKDTIFQSVDDRGYAGGGFIHEDTLQEILVNKAGMSPAAAGRVAAIQVRLFIPSMGIYKGMLVKKRTRNGAPIELPCSMQKVLRSTHPKRLAGAYMLICKGKVFPSPGSANEYIGRKLDEALNAPPATSFALKTEKPLTSMILRLWETMGVPNELCHKYKKESLVPARRNHAWLAGVPDPTNCLPPDTIFVPGFSTRESFDMFVTRCPCYAHEHGRKFQALSEKPQSMSSEDWEWLSTKFRFGTIIFSNPRPGMMSIPERIAGGDLDGDLYLVCWDQEIVRAMNAVPLVDKPVEDDGKLSKVPSNPDWFCEAQDQMLETLRFDLGRLIGTLYKLAEKLTHESELKLKDPDVHALYEAYNEALNYQKHGRSIRLPKHLIEKLPENLRQKICVIE